MESEEQQQAPGLVVFVHPDGRLLPAVIVGRHGENIADLVVFEGETAGSSGTKVYNGVGYSDLVADQEPARHTWHF